MALAAAAVLLAGAAQAASLRYFAYDADSAAARYRSADIIVAVRKGLLSSRIVTLYRKRGKDLALERPDGTFSLRQLAAALGETEQDVLDLKLYAVDVKDGEGFAQGACKGAERAWLATKPVRAYEPLRLYVIKYDAAARAPALCEQLDYRWRGEWKVPPARNRSTAEEYGGPKRR